MTNVLRERERERERERTKVRNPNDNNYHSECLKEIEKQ